MLDIDPAHLKAEGRDEQVLELREKLKKSLVVQDWRKFFIELKLIYAYVYFPVELEVESFTKI